MKHEEMVGTDNEEPPYEALMSEALMTESLMREPVLAVLMTEHEAQALLNLCAVSPAQLDAATEAGLLGKLGRLVVLFGDGPVPGMAH